MARGIRWQPFGIPPGTWDDAASEQSIRLSMRRPREDSGKAPGSRLITVATVLLGLLAAGLFVVSLQAQYMFIWAEKHAAIPSMIEAVGLDVGMAIFSLLALGLAMAGQSARVERALIVACAAGSALMNYAAANGGSPRSVAAYVVPPVFLAIVVDRVVAVVRRHVLGDTERSTWAAVGRGAGRVALYGLRFALAAPSTCTGLRQQVLIMTPLPEAEAAPTAALPSGDPEPEVEPTRGLSPICIAPGVLGICGSDLPCPSHGYASRSDKPEAVEPARERSGRHRQPDGESKTAKFLRLVEDRHGPLAAINPAHVSRISTELAPLVDLHTGSARSVLGQRVRATQNGNSHG